MIIWFLGKLLLYWNMGSFTKIWTQNILCISFSGFLKIFLRLRGMFGKCSCEFCFHKIWTQYINFLAAFTSMFFFLTLAGLDTLSAKMKQGFIFRESQEPYDLLMTYQKISIQKFNIVKLYFERLILICFVSCNNTP